MRYLICCFLFACIFPTVGCEEDKKVNVSPVKQFALDDTDPFQRVMTSTPDGVIAIGSHGKVHVGCVNSKEFRVLDGFNSTVNRIALNANGTRVGVCAGPEAIVWDIKSGKEVARHKLPTKQYWYEGIQFRADDESAYLLTHYDGVLLDWNFAKNEVNPVFNLANSQTFPEEWRGRVIHASGLLVKNDTTALIFRAPGIVEYNLKTNTERFIKFNKPLSVAALAISPDQKSIAVNTGNTFRSYAVGL